MHDITVMIADDHQIFRDGIMSLLNDVKEIKIIDVAGTGEELVIKASEQQPDVVLLDLSMPGMTGFEAIAMLKESAFGIKILVMSMHAGEDYISKAIRLGADGYLLKQETNKKELVTAIKNISEGKQYFSEGVNITLKEMHLRELQSKPKKKDDINLLTKREIEILKLVVEGLSNTEIASKLFLSIKTIETHKFNIMQKLQLKNSIELVKYAIKNNILEI